MSTLSAPALVKLPDTVTGAMPPSPKVPVALLVNELFRVSGVMLVNPKLPLIWLTPTPMYTLSLHDALPIFIAKLAPLALVRAPRVRVLAAPAGKKGLQIGRGSCRERVRVPVVARLLQPSEFAMSTLSAAALVKLPDHVTGAMPPSPKVPVARLVNELFRVSGVMLVNPMLPSFWLNRVAVKAKVAFCLDEPIIAKLAPLALVRAPRVRVLAAPAGKKGL